MQFKPPPLQAQCPGVSPSAYLNLNLLQGTNGAVASAKKSKIEPAFISASSAIKAPRDADIPPPKPPAVSKTEFLEKEPRVTLPHDPVSEFLFVGTDLKPEHTSSKKICFF